MSTTLIRGQAGRVDRALNPTADLELSTRILSQVAANHELGSVVRIYRPAPTVAFSGIERRMPRFGEAVGEAVAFGFEPVIRPAGGRMVALDEQWLVMDVITPEVIKSDSRSVYLNQGRKLVDILKGFEIQAGIGAVPGEYCPGDYSINARGQVKLVGTAQRVVRGARLFSASIPISVSRNVAQMFDRINAHLDLDWDNRTLGSIENENASVSIDELEQALIAVFAPTAGEGVELADILEYKTPLTLIR